MKRCALVGLLFCLLPPAFPIPITWKWTSGGDSSVRYFRYQLNGEKEEGWTVVENTVGEVHLDVDTHATMYVQASYDGLNWSNSTSSSYIAASLASSPDAISSEKSHPLSLRLSFTPYSCAIYYFYNGEDVQGAKNLTGSVYGLSSSLELDWCPIKALRLYPEAGYTFSLKPETVLPQENDVHYGYAGVGADWVGAITEKNLLYVGLLGGAMAHINNSKVNITPYFGLRMGFETKLTQGLYLGVMAKGAMAFLVTDDPLFDSVTMLIDPLSLSLRYEW